MRQVAIAVVLLGFAVPSVHAQGGRGGGAFTRVAVEPEVVKGGPYSAEVIN